MPRVLAHWWNGRSAEAERRDVWVGVHTDGVFEVRWRGADYRNPDGRHWASDRHIAWRVVRKLLSEPTQTWTRVDTPPRHRAGSPLRPERTALGRGHPNDASRQRPDRVPATPRGHR